MVLELNPFDIRVSICFDRLFLTQTEFHIASIIVNLKKQKPVPDAVFYKKVKRYSSGVTSSKTYQCRAEISRKQRFISSRL